MQRDADTDPRKTAAGMRGVYERQAAAWDAARSRDLYEAAWLDRALAMTAPGEWVLDLGCGAGEPVARYVVAQGRRVLGVDFAAPMIKLARARMPDQRWAVADMRGLDLDAQFAAIIGWDSFFHLTPSEQVALIPLLARHLAPGGALLLTVGPAAGEPLGEVCGEAVYHASLAPDDYRMRLAAAGIKVVDFVPNDQDCAGRSVLLGKRS
ncbi:class I SAM-dependent methyltransferase [Tabrizicola sp.]|uniref:class I SAM-dependent DNA methyltransferase n=1 Tax=Tabrizicola sp. TaxID=2005166 RepID=UPI00286D1A41|nr:class I SAM-dependent methyltransferase [Tabrizicola sp.]